MQQPYAVDLIEALYPAAEKRGYHLVLGAMLSTRDERKAMEELLGYRSEALILIGPESDTQELVDVAQRIQSSKSAVA